MKQRINTLLIFFLFAFSCLSQNLPQSVLSDYLKIKSDTGNAKNCGLFIEKLCHDFGLYTTVLTDNNKAYNFCASVLPLNTNKKSVVLLNHMDVVPANDTANWRFMPYSGTVYADTLYGRGSIDMKGPAIMQLFALKNILKSVNKDSLPYNFILLCLSDEENGGKNGAAQIINSETIKMLNPMVVYGEGGGGLTHVIPGKENELCFFVSNAEKKSLWIKLEAKVKTKGHGSVSNNKTAHKLLLRAINKIENTEQRIVIDRSTKRTFRELGKITGGYKGFILKHFDWWIFKPLRRKIINANENLKVLVSNSYQLTRMDNPDGPVNQVAQSAAAYYDCRLLPNKTERPLLMKFLFRILDPRIKITVLDESPNAESTNPDEHYIYIKNAIHKSFQKAHVIPVLFPATTDNSYFRSIDIPVYGLLPFELNEPMIESVHSANEKIPLKAIDTGIKIYTDLLYNYTGVNNR